MATLKNNTGNNNKLVNFGNFKKTLKHLCDDGRIYLIILLGIGGMVVYTQFFFSHLQPNKFKKEHWVVIDTSTIVTKKTTGKKTIITKTTTITTEDTLKIVYHPGIGVRRDSAVKERALTSKSGLKLDNTDYKSTINYKQLYFSYNSAFLVWIAIGAISFAFGLASLPVMWMAIRNLILQFEIKRWTIGFITLFSAVLCVLMYFTDKIGYYMGTIAICRKFHILVTNPNYLPYFVIISMVVGLFGFAGQMIVNAAINKLPKTIPPHNKAEQKNIGKKFLLLRNQLKFFLVIDSILIVFSVLTVDAFRKAILADIQVNLDIVPQSLVYLYGLMFTFYLAVIYLPIYSRLKLKGEQMLDNVTQADQEGNLKSITAILRIQQTPIESFQVVISILAPVLTSLVPGLLKI
jgi:hypothetical protein